MLNMVKENFGTVVVLINSANTMELGFLEEDDVDAALWLGCLGSPAATPWAGALRWGEPSGRTTSTLPTLESAPSYYSFGDYDYTNVTYTNTSPISATPSPTPTTMWTTWRASTWATGTMRPLPPTASSTTTRLSSTPSATV